jgi:hypothetical protein
VRFEPISINRSTAYEDDFTYVIQRRSGPGDWQLFITPVCDCESVCMQTAGEAHPTIAIAAERKRELSLWAKCFDANPYLGKAGTRVERTQRFIDSIDWDNTCHQDTA